MAPIETNGFTAYAECARVSLAELAILVVRSAGKGGVVAGDWDLDSFRLVHSVCSVDEARQAIRSTHFDLALLVFDPISTITLGLVREIASVDYPIAIVVLSSRLDDAELLAELQTCDVCVLPKPCPADAIQNVFRHAMARIRQDQMKGSSRLRAGQSLLINRDEGIIAIGGRTVSLSPRIFKLADLLLSNDGCVVPAMELARGALERSDASAPEAVRGAIRELRHALTNMPLVVDNVRGYGYRLRLRQYDSHAKRTETNGEQTDVDALHV
jgi:DNA-binding response OmpR family regulator